MQVNSAIKAKLVYAYIYAAWLFASLVHSLRHNSIPVRARNNYGHACLLVWCVIEWLELATTRYIAS